MVLKILGNWKYTPEACGNKSMVIEFKRLSGKDEMKIGRDDLEALPLRRFDAYIVGITNPFKLEMPDGAKRDMTVEDIYSIPELADLYYELVIEYADKTMVTPDSVKKPE